MTSPELAELATAHHVAPSYTDWQDHRVDVAEETLIDVLAALGVDASTPAAVAQALAAARDATASRPLPPTIVAVAGEDTALPVGPEQRVTLRAETGEVIKLHGNTVNRDLPIGWYDLLVEGHDPVTLMVAPRRLELPRQVTRAWGWMVQLYSVRSAGSWGIGDYRDLAELVTWSGSADGGRAGFVVCNPVHAVTPVQPIENSPYFPSSRRFYSVLYLRIEDVPEYAACDQATKAAIAALRPSGGDRIDRDDVWRAKRAALRKLWPWARRERIDEFRRDQGEQLGDFALFCALAERYGGNWRTWPANRRTPDHSGLDAELSERVDFYVWLQLLCAEQLRASAEAGTDMAVGVIHDLAVGVDPDGADAWALQNVLAGNATVGVPPDAFNQLGQDWRLPPWHPARLAEAGYRPFRDVIRCVLRYAGGIRVDHIMALFRLWWIPEGNQPDSGAYVSYDDHAMLAAVMIEAHRAGAVVIGEDLGTVEPRVAEALAAAGILGSDVAWFEQEDDRPRPPARWRSAALASVTTHDLPTVAGWFTDAAVRVRAELDQLTVPVTEELAKAAAQRAALLTLLHDEGLLDPRAADLEDVNLALHRLLVMSPARLIAAALGDAIGDLRQPNLPGTRDEYPNWRLPVADRHGRPVTLEVLRSDPSVRRLVDVLAEVLDPPPEHRAEIG